MTPAWRYLLWNTTKVTLSSPIPVLAASPLVFVLSQTPMSCHIFQYFRSNLDFSALQSVILSISVLVDGSYSS